MSLYQILILITYQPFLTYPHEIEADSQQLRNSPHVQGKGLSLNRSTSIPWHKREVSLRLD